MPRPRSHSVYWLAREVLQAHPDRWFTAWDIWLELDRDLSGVYRVVQELHIAGWADRRKPNRKPGQGGPIASEYRWRGSDTVRETTATRPDGRR